ncbi:MAG: acyl-CoA/acyl-ACP dehydrogenase, partial [Actinomycetota bacterium]|nr:acyl-CoA/acyl-ACP dehydrogenase [Actinomycetota bacterium]
MATTTEERLELATAARRLCRERFGAAAVRRLRDDPPPAGEAETWPELAGLGWTGLLVDPSLGGSGAGMAEVVVVLAELGRVLAVTPMLASAVVAVTALSAAGAPEPFRARLEELARGESVVVVAHTEGDEFQPAEQAPTAVTATRVDDAWRVVGTKRWVPFAPAATHLLVTATTNANEGAFAGVLVDAADRGVGLVAGRSLDGHPIAHVDLDVVVPIEHVVEDIRPGLDLAHQRGFVALAATMAGGQRRALELTTTHLRERIQFGVPIGAFQALQHRAADLHCEVERSDAIVARAARSIDQDATKARRAVHAAMVTVARSYLR